MKYENESDPSVNWGHLNDVDFTADTDHVTAEAAERYAYDQAELWAERQAEIDAEAQAEREWMEQGGTPARVSIQDTIGEIAHMMMHLDEALRSLFCATDMDPDDDDHWLDDYFSPADVYMTEIFELLGVERTIPQCLHCGDETFTQGRSDETDTQ